MSVALGQGDSYIVYCKKIKKKIKYPPQIILNKWCESACMVQM